MKPFPYSALTVILVPMVIFAIYLLIQCLLPMKKGKVVKHPSALDEMEEKIS